MLLSKQKVLILLIAFRFGFAHQDFHRFTVEKATPITLANSCCVKNERCLIHFIFRKTCTHLLFLYQSLL